MASRYQKFKNKIVFKQRNVDIETDENARRLLNDLENLSKSSDVIFETDNETFFRARELTKNIFPKGSRKFKGLSRKDSDKPPADKTKGYRANYDHIPHLYCASNEETAVREIRPGLNHHINIATIRPKKNMRFLDLTRNSKTLTCDTQKNLYEALADWFSRPVTNEDNPEEYIPTQFLAEYIKTKCKLDGIKYKSSMSQTNGYNYVIFSEKYEIIGSYIIQISINQKNESIYEIKNV